MGEIWRSVNVTLGPQGTSPTLLLILVAVACGSWYEVPANFGKPCTSDLECGFLETRCSDPHDGERFCTTSCDAWENPCPWLPEQDDLHYAFEHEYCQVECDTDTSECLRVFTCMRRPE